MLQYIYMNKRVLARTSKQLDKVVSRNMRMVVKEAMSCSGGLYFAIKFKIEDDEDPLQLKSTSALQYWTGPACTPGLSHGLSSFQCRLGPLLFRLRQLGHPHPLTSPPLPR